MKIIYQGKETEKLCTDYKYAQRILGKKIAMKIAKSINMLESMSSLHDAIMYKPFNFHGLKGDREGQHAIDVAGRKSGYRFILEPLNEDGKRYDLDSRRIDFISKSTRMILIVEVSDHYE